MTNAWQHVYLILDGPIFIEVNNLNIKTLLETLSCLIILSLGLYCIFKEGTSVDRIRHCVVASILLFATYFVVIHISES